MKIKVLPLIIILCVMTSIFSGCQTIYNILAPEEYKENAEGFNDYPEEALPIYTDAVVYEYESDEESISLTYGTDESLYDISDYYINYFADNNIYLSNEKDRSKTYLADGEMGYYVFELTIEDASGKWEERLFSSVVEINLEIVNIPDKNELKEYISQVEEDIKVFDYIFEEDEAMDNSDEEDFQYYSDALAEMILTIEELDSTLSVRDVPEYGDFLYIHESETVITQMLTNVLNDFKEFVDYAAYFYNNGEDFIDYYDTTYKYWYDEFEDIEYIFGDFANDLENANPPTSVLEFNESFIEVLNNTVSMAEYCMDALDYDDYVKFYAGLYSYEITFRDLNNALDTFLKDMEIIETRLDEEQVYIESVIADLKEWINSASEDVQKDAESLTAVPDSLIMGEEETEVSYEYYYPDYIIPSNYRSLDYITFIELYTNKGTANVMLTVEIPGFTQVYEQKLEISRAETEVKIHPPLLADALESLNSSQDAQIAITLQDLDTGEYILQETINITIYSRYDMQWYDEDDNSYVENILAWMTPEADEISTLLRSSADSVDYLTEGLLDSMIGYQWYSDWYDYQITYVQTAAVMHALATEMNVVYVAEWFSATSTELQRVKTPSEVINDESGLCVETSLTVASALQAMGMHVVLIFPPGHTQVAVETWDGSGEYYLIETTALESAAAEDWDSVIYYLDSDDWDYYLSQDWYVAIDCDLADEYGIKSIN